MQTKNSSEQWFSPFCLCVWSKAGHLQKDRISCTPQFACHSTTRKQNKQQQKKKELWLHAIL